MIFAQEWQFRRTSVWLLLFLKHLIFSKSCLIFVSPAWYLFTGYVNRDIVNCDLICSVLIKVRSTQVLSTLTRQQVAGKNILHISEILENKLEVQKVELKNIILLWYLNKKLQWHLWQNSRNCQLPNLKNHGQNL